MITLDSFNDQDDHLKGRLALWLKPKDIQILLNEYRKIPSNAPVSVRDAWSRIAIRASSALYKEGIPMDTIYPDEDERYRIVQESEESF
jgi:hypothetical protein